MQGLAEDQPYEPEMKLMQRSTISSLVWASLLSLTGCSVQESANDSPRCQSTVDCSDDRICYRGFCLIDTTGIDGLKPDGTDAASVNDAASPELDATPELVADASATANDGGASEDAGTDTPAPLTDAGPVALDASTPSVDAGLLCSREVLRERADAYLAAMTMGNASSLRTHPSLRYTENGQGQRVGMGVWTTRPRVQFARHVLDETSCGSITEAVLQSTTGRIVFGVRLRYQDDQLLEAEAQVVTPNLQFFNPDDVVVSGADPWIEPVPDAMRMSREALIRLATNYFDATTETSLLPPHADSCRRRQNGVLMANQGNCGARPGTKPFEERRYPLVDETTGIVTAIVIYDRYVGMYLFKVAGGVVQNIDIVGGAQTRTSGW